MKRAVSETTRKISSVPELLENMLCQGFVDFAMPGNGLSNTRSSILVPVVLATMANEFAAGLLELANQIGSLHKDNESSATRRIPGMWPLFSSP